MADSGLVSRVRGGDSEAYAELIRLHYPKVFGLCLSLLKDRGAANDAAQEVFLKAYRSLKDFKGAASFSTWIHKIASNHCLDFLRRKSRDKTQSLEALLESRGGDWSESSGEPRAAEASLASADSLERLLSRLSDERRLVLALREVQGLSYKEMTEVLDCSLDSVKSKLKRARAELREISRHFLSVDFV